MREDEDYWAEMQDQWEVENARAWQHFIALGVALVIGWTGSFLIGLFFGWLIWGI